MGNQLSSNKIFFIADFFTDQVQGGGELNNEIIIDILRKKYDVEKINCHLMTMENIVENKGLFFIISNFINLSEEKKDYIKNNCRYAIYEHDHKYIKTRNPADYEDFLAPKEEIINYDFYKNAKAILCQSKFHSDIVRKNLNLDNIVNLGGNAWHDKDLEKMEEFSKREKLDKYSIMDSRIGHKNTKGSISYCMSKGHEYELIPSLKYHFFLDRISKNEKFVFFPLSPETLSRVVVEARMMNMKVTTSKNVGAISEDWFKLKGLELIDFMRNKKIEISKKIEDIIDG
tara:strand:- start:38 stop:898 length:861 start_codon:yes stop_codon:yes gene_type:complete